jgi:hypothetical protein
MGALSRVIEAFADWPTLRSFLYRKQRRMLSMRQVTAKERVKQTQLAWFDYERTFTIKLQIFMKDKRRDLLRHWFLRKRQPPNNWHFKKLHRLSMEDIFAGISAPAAPTTGIARRGQVESFAVT